MPPSGETSRNARQRLLALGALLAGILTAAPPARGADHPFEFAGSGDIPVVAGRSARLTLVNNTTTAFDVVLRVDMDAAGGGAGMLPATLDRRRVPLASGGMAVVTLSAQGPGGTVARGGKASGFVVAVGGPVGNVVVARRAFSVASQEGKPLAAAWSVTSFRWKPFGEKTVNRVLPLESGIRCDRLALPEALGGPSTKARGGARVEGVCTTDGVVAGTTGLALAFPGLQHATGDYTGKIDLAPSDEKTGEVELSVRRTDFVALPLFFLLLGIAGAVVLAWWSNRLNALSEREERMWQLFAQAQEAQQGFEAASAGKPWLGYSLQPAFGQRLAEVQLTLRALTGRFGKLDEQDPQLEEVEEALAELDKLVRAWRALGPRLAELATALDKVRDEPSRPRDMATARPAFVKPAERLLLGIPLSFAELLGRVEQVEQTASVAEAWPGQNRKVVELRARARVAEAAMTDLPPAHTDWPVLQQATRTLNAAAKGLFDAKDANELAGRDMAACLEDARTLLDSLSVPKPERRPAPLGPEAEAPAALEASGHSGLAEALSVGGPSPGTVADRIAARRRFRNLSALAVLAVVTAFGGLTLLYFDRPFGTPRDYLAITLWGFGAQAALEALVAGLDRLVGSGSGGPSTAGGMQPSLWVSF